jgi:hypothetical protein
MNDRQCAEFDCAGCGRHIIAVALSKPPADLLCGGCRIIGPVRYKAFQDHQDGEISEQAFREIFENAPPYEPPTVR